MRKIIALLIVMVIIGGLPNFTVMASNGVKDLEIKNTFYKDRLGIFHNVSIKNLGKESYVIFYVLFEYYGSDEEKANFTTEKQLDGLVRPNESRTFENISSGVIPGYILSNINNVKVIVNSVVTERENRAGKKDVDEIIESLKRHGEFESFKKEVSEMLDNQ